MDKKLKTKWVKALRSGKYRQGRSEMKQTELKDEGAVTTFCCLGVLRDLMYPTSKAQGCTEISERVLSGRHAKEAGIEPQHQDALCGMNDAGKSFRAIATYIEKKL